MRRQLKHLALTVTAAVLLALPAGCSAGGLSTASDPSEASGPSKADICNQASTALEAFNASVAKIDVANDGTAEWEAKAKELSKKLGQIAGRTEDAELKRVLLEMSSTWGSFRLDDPAGGRTDKLLNEQPEKLGKACV
jgi:hypothetical protein